MLRELTRRGPNAFNAFLDICNANFHEAALILNRSPPANLSAPYNNNEVMDISIKQMKKQKNAMSTIDKNKLQLFTEELHVQPLEVTKSTKFMTDPTVGVYDMNSRNRGICFLVNIIDFKNEEPRRGAEHDKINLISLFRQMGFGIFYYENLTLEVSVNVK